MSLLTLIIEKRCKFEDIRDARECKDEGEVIVKLYHNYILIDADMARVCLAYLIKRGFKVVD